MAACKCPRVDQKNQCLTACLRQHSVNFATDPDFLILFTSAFPALTPGKLRLYNMRFCPYSETARLALAHKNIEHETVNIDLKQKPSWFLDRNPTGNVPNLEQDDKVIYESLVCADYLDEVYPNNKLTPSEPYRRALDRIIVELFSKTEAHFYKISFAPKDAIKGFYDALDPVEKALAERGTPFFGGSSVQMVDLMIWPHVERFDAVTQLVKEARVTADRYPKLTKWIENMGKVPAVQQCRWDTPAHIHFIETTKAGKPDYDFGL
ncbi:glutathione S-transferase omega-1-like [Haliotis rufescens]|uniref:glutathione S-transferase omega-1-like n=1 Tax=Haliotis rufescens TaxID=6454 RepID=UPI00201F2DAF|nr:glutathione S-transferase omega-1-like [Haliotis rufescens]